MMATIKKHQGIGDLAPKGWYTRSQVADLIGRSSETVKRWHFTGVYKATNQMPVGDLRVWVYNDEDIAEMKKIKTTMHPGRKKKKPLTEK